MSMQPSAQRFQSPRLSSAHPHLDVFISEEILDKCPVNSGHARVMDSKAIGQQVLQLQVLGSRDRTGDEESLPEGTLPERKPRRCPSPSPETQPVTPCPVKQHRQAALEDGPADTDTASDQE